MGGPTRDVTDQDAALDYGRRAANDRATAYGRRVAQGRIAAGVAGGQGMFDAALVTAFHAGQSPLDFTIRTVSELSPLGGDLNGEGYPSVFYALLAASQLDRVGVVARDNQQRYAVFRSDQQKGRVRFKGLERYFTLPTPSLAATRWRHVRFANLVEASDASAWPVRVSRLRTASEYVLLLRETASLFASEVHPVQLGEYRSGRINIDVALRGEGYLGNTGWMDANGRFISLREAGRRFQDKRQPLPLSVMVLAPEAFEQGSALRLLMTLAHESTHHQHNERVLGFVRQWRASSSTNIHAWIKEMKKAKELDDEYYHVFADALNGFKGTTEVIAFAQKFMAGYPWVQLPSETDFLDLVKIETYWRASKEIKSAVLRRLRRFHRALPSLHRTTFSEYLRTYAGKRDFFHKDLYAVLGA